MNGFESIFKSSDERPHRTPAAAQFGNALGLHPLVAEILWQRGIQTLEQARAFLNPSHYTPASPFDLPDMDVAVARLQRAIQAQEHIRIWGDFDVDGQTATSLLFLGLRALGAHVDYTIPDRAVHSHGLNREGLQKAKDDGVRIVLTCDCGVTDFEQIEFAVQLGLEIIITDHHDLAVIDEAAGPMMPAAQAIVNPKRLPGQHPPGQHPLIHLPGVGVAYKLIEALHQRQEGQSSAADATPDKPDTPPFNPTALLDLVAIGIVGDLAVQKADTRYLLQVGLQRLRVAARPGVRALLRMAGLSSTNSILSIDSDTISFQIGPRLNAAGRLASAELSVQLLTADTDAEAAAIASRIETLNNERKVVQRAIEQDALAMLMQDPALAAREVIVLQGPQWSASVIGVVANGIVERYGRPTVLIAVQPGELGRGSARSVPNIDIHAAISAQARLIEASGGHPMAAGFAIRSENVAAFTEGVVQHVAGQHSAAQRAGQTRPTLNAVPGVTSRTSNTFTTDIYEVKLADATLELATQIEQLAPFGSGNPRPWLRATALHIVRADPLGADGRHQMLQVVDRTDVSARVVWWKGGNQPVPNPGIAVSVVFNLRRNIFQGKARAQLELVALEPALAT